MAHAQNNTMDTGYGHQDLQAPTECNSPEQQSYQTSTDINQSVVDLLRQETVLAHTTQCLHQQTMDVLHNIAKSSALQENVHFINDIPMFKAKDPQSCNDWLDQINKVVVLTSNGPYKLALAKSQGSVKKPSAHIHLHWIGRKLKIVYTTILAL